MGRARMANARAPVKRVRVASSRGVSPRRLAAFYSGVTSLYGAYGGRARSWHWGLWEPGVHSRHRAFLRSNEVVVEGLEISSRTRILDAGCGIGGFAVWAASKFGCHVTGITICSAHARLAAEYARRRGVGHLCEFRRMNMDRIRFRAASFDLVVNQESFSHSLDKSRYLYSLADVLSPGGVWRCIDTCVVPEKQRSAEARRLWKTVSDGFCVPSLPSIVEVQRLLRVAGFVDVRTSDLSAHVLPNHDRMAPLPFALAALFPEWLLAGSRSVRRYEGANHRAAYAYMLGLRHGCFRHVFHHACLPPVPRRATRRSQRQP
jgi:cyclopropane fatty-acyl-phospholipid synthase-like methyltransferase